MLLTLHFHVYLHVPPSPSPSPSLSPSLSLSLSQKLTEEKIERLHQLEEEMAGLARKIHAHEEARKSASPLPPSNSRSTKDTDFHGRNHIMNGVLHSPK